MKRCTWLKGLLALVLAVPWAARAAVIDLYVPGISGEDSPPGYPGAMRVQSFTFSAGAFSVVKAVDSASPQIAGAVTGGTPLGTSQVLLYNGSTPSGPPAALAAFANTFASSSQLQGGNPATELDSFLSTEPAEIYLELPGISGESSTPGHPDVLLLESFTLAAGEFSIVKAVDSASPQIAAAIIGGTPFSAASLLIYNTAPSGPADAMFVFHNVLASSTQLLGGVTAREQDTFAFATVTPEPALYAALLAVALYAAFHRPRRHRGRIS